MKLDFSRIVFFALLIFLLASTLGCTAKKQNNTDISSTAPPPQITVAADQNIDPIRAAEIAEQKKIAEITPLVDRCLGKPTDIEVEICLLDLAKSSETDYPCGKMNFISKDRCYFEVASVTHSDTTCGKISKPMQVNTCLNDAALATKKPEICLKILDPRYRDECIKPIAESNKSQEQCELLFDSTKRNDCYINVTGANKNDEFCQKIGERQDALGFERDRCYFASNGAMHGEKCFLLLGDGVRRQCFLDATNVADKNVMCEKNIDTPSAENCIFWYATTRLEVSQCQKLPYAQGLNCVAKILAGTPGVEQCRAFADLNESNLCYYKAAIDGNNESPCTQIEGVPLDKDICFNDIAIQKLDIEICKNLRINNFSGRDACFSKIATDTKDYAACEYVTADKGYYKCFSGVAIGLNVPEICGKAERDQLKTLPYHPREYCYLQYAVDKPDSIGCSYINAPVMRNGCYFKYVEATDDEKACINISDKNQLFECRKIS